jgi:hypothetical protein
MQSASDQLKAMRMTILMALRFCSLALDLVKTRSVVLAELSAGVSSRSLYPSGKLPDKFCQNLIFLTSERDQEFASFAL